LITNISILLTQKKIFSYHIICRIGQLCANPYVTLKQIGQNEKKNIFVKKNSEKSFVPKKYFGQKKFV
jgi:hypothetical protein